jgi:amino acid transporter
VEISAHRSTAVPGLDAPGAPPQTPPGGLRRDSLSLLEVIAIAIAVIAPTANAALAVPGVYGLSGDGTWLAYLIAMLALAFVALNINAFARHEASPGALYVVAAKGCGPLWGVIAGWSLLIGYVFTASALISGSAGYLLVLLRQLTPVGSDILGGAVFSVALLGVAWGFAFRGVKLSSRTSLAIEAATVAIILGLVVGAMWIHGPAVDHAQITLRGVTHGQIRLGLVLAFFSFVGFEAATAVGAEVRNPFKTVPHAVLSSVVVCGLFYVFVAYGVIAAFHHLGQDLSQTSAPLATIAAGLGLTGFGAIISLGVALSGFACTLGSVNAGSRVLYALSRHGLFSSRASRTHADHATPHVALAVVAMTALGVSLCLTFLNVPFLDAFAYLGSLSSFGFIFVYILVSAGTPLYLRKRGLLRPGQVASSIIAVALLGVALYGSVYPVPSWPLDVIPYVFLALVMAGVAYFLVLQLFAPERLSIIEADFIKAEL